MTDCEIKLRVRPWPSRLVRLYKANRSIGFGRLQALSMAWALTWCAWPMTTLKFIARSASAGLTGYVGALAIYVATVGAPDDATIAGGIQCMLIGAACLHSAWVVSRGIRWPASGESARGQVR